MFVDRNSAVEMTSVVSDTYAGRLAKSQLYLSVLNCCWKNIRLCSRNLKNQTQLINDHGITGFNDHNHQV